MAILTSVKWYLIVNELIYKTEIDFQTLKKKKKKTILQLPKGKCGVRDKLGVCD